MSRGQFAVLTLMLMFAVLAGVLVASIAPPLTTAQAQELKLAPPPSASPTVVIPSFADLVEIASPSVVHVEAVQLVEQGNGEGGNRFEEWLFRRFMREPFREDESQQPPPEPRESAGSGFFFTTDGYVLTNRHVVENADRLVVRTLDDDQFEARLVGSDPYLDLAVLKVNSAGTFPALPLGNSDELRVGEWVIAIGNPLVFRNSVTVGVVSGKGRRIGGDQASLDSFIQTDAPINFGNSGGPLINARGEVVGINTAIVRDDPNSMRSSGLVEGIGFALPISPIRRVVEQLVATGTVKRGYLGVTVRPLDRDMADYYGIDDSNGALVVETVPDLPAARAGILEEDVIFEVDGLTINDSQDLVNAISGHSPGDSVRLKIWRGGDEREVEVRLEERRVGRDGNEPEAPQREEPSSASATGLGLTVQPLTDRQREQFGYADARGVIVMEVDPLSAAGGAGVRMGLVIVDVNGRPTPDLASYEATVSDLESGSVVRLRLALPGGNENLIFFRVP